MEINRVVEEITQLSQSVDSQKLWQNGDALGQLCVKLASLVAYLGDSIVVAELQADQLQTAYRYEKNQIFLRLVEQKYSIDKANAQAEVELMDKYSEYLEYKNKTRLLNLKRMDTNNLIDSMRSRLSYMKSEMVNA